MSHPALTRLRALRYFAVMPSLPPPLSDWLLLEDSMTQRFEQQGKQVTVTLVNEGYIGRDALTDEAALLPDEPRYWLREIILNADGEPSAGRAHGGAGVDAVWSGAGATAARANSAGPIPVYVVDINPRFY